MKKIKYLLFGICALCCLVINSTDASADYFDMSGSMNVKFNARFVYPDGTPVKTSNFKLESKINYVPHYSTTYLNYQVKPSQILRNTKVIPTIGNGVYSDSYKTGTISNKIVEPYNTMEGSRVSYNSLFADTMDSVKGITLIRSVGSYSYQTFYASGQTLPINYYNYYAQGSFVRKTISGRTGFQFENPALYSDIGDCLFASSFASTNASEGQPGVKTYTGITFFEYVGIDRRDNGPVTFRLDLPQIKETFIDQDHNEIAAADLDNSLVCLLYTSPSPRDS